MDYDIPKKHNAYNQQRTSQQPSSPYRYIGMISRAHTHTHTHTHTHNHMQQCTTPTTTNQTTPKHHTLRILTSNDQHSTITHHQSLHTHTHTHCRHIHRPHPNRMKKIRISTVFATINTHIQTQHNAYQQQRTSQPP